MFCKAVFFFQVIILFMTPSIFSQTKNSPDSLLHNVTLQNCIYYALENQPSIKQSLIDESIANQEIKSKLADWFPQLNFNFNFQHNYKLQTSVFQGNTVHFGVVNTSSAQFSLSQTIFDRDVLLASTTAGDVRKQTEESATENKINVVVNVSKAFYAALLAQNQIDLINEDLTRLKQSEKDTYNQYKSGVVDKTDYMRATVALNNAKAEQKQDEEMLKASYANLKEQMGYPANSELKLSYDTTKMEADIFIDTTQSIDSKNRIEYQLLQTEKRLQEANLHYYEWSFIPTLSAFGNYNFNFLNDELSKLYNQNYPSAYVGLQLSFPIFQGGKRFQEIEQAKLELERYDYDFESLENFINTQYVQALSNYKSNLNNFLAQKENLNLARDVYNTIDLQYKSGVKSYLEVITAETDLRTTQVNYINALYQVLSSKLDVQRALGTIKY
jgi:outer membrane protein